MNSCSAFADFEHELRLLVNKYPNYEVIIQFYNSINNTVVLHYALVSKYIFVKLREDFSKLNPKKMTFNVIDYGKIICVLLVR